MILSFASLATLQFAVSWKTDIIHVKMMMSCCYGKKDTSSSQCSPLSLLPCLFFISLLTHCLLYPYRQEQLCAHSCCPPTLTCSLRLSHRWEELNLLYKYVISVFCGKRLVRSNKQKIGKQVKTPIKKKTKGCAAVFNHIFPSLQFSLTFSQHQLILLFIRILG